MHIILVQKKYISMERSREIYYHSKPKFVGAVAIHYYGMVPFIFISTVAIHFNEMIPLHFNGTLQLNTNGMVQSFLWHGIITF